VKARVHKVTPDLFLVELPVPIAGFEHFVASWVLTGPPAVVVDPGPAVTAPALLEALEQLGMDRPDYILLTHIHIDHAGGIGQVAEAFAETPVVCHQAAVAHLADPSRLWQGSLKVLGETARRYGPIEPVAKERILSAGDLDVSGIRVLDTPGHSPHHCSFVIGDILFAGETGGVCLSLDDGADYLRPATPPRFFFDTQLASLEKLMKAPARILCYGHFGARDRDSGLLERHRDQLRFWRQKLASILEPEPRPRSGLPDRCLEALLAADPLLAGFSRLPEDVQAREKTFLTNSIKGFIGYLQSL